MWSTHLNSSSFFCSPDRGVDGETNDEEKKAVEHAEDRGAALIRDRQVRGAWTQGTLDYHSSLRILTHGAVVTQPLCQGLVNTRPRQAQEAADDQGGWLNHE